MEIFKIEDKRRISIVGTSQVASRKRAWESREIQVLGEQATVADMR